MCTPKQRDYILGMVPVVGAEHARAAIGPALWLAGAQPLRPNEPLETALDRLTFAGASLAVESLMARAGGHLT
jgi:hypothetical protein